MIVLDTNVISELMRPLPHAGVMAWVAAQPRDVLYTTSITRAELLYGVAAMPEGKRRETLSALVEAMFAEDFVGRVLPFDAAAAPNMPGLSRAEPEQAGRSRDSTRSSRLRSREQEQASLRAMSVVSAVVD